MSSSTPQSFYFSPMSNPESSSRKRSNRRRMKRKSDTGLSTDTPNRHRRAGVASLANSGSANNSTVSDPLATSRSSALGAQNSFGPSVLALCLFAFVFMASECGAASPLLAGATILVTAAFMWQWLDLYGSHLSRDDHITFDYANILATSDNLGFNLPPVDHPPTLGRGEIYEKYKLEDPKNILDPNENIKDQKADHNRHRYRRDGEAAVSQK